MGGTRCAGRKPRISRCSVFFLGWLRTASSPGARLRGTYQPMGLRISREFAIAKPCWLLLVRAWPLCWSQTSSRAGAGDLGKGPGPGAPRPSQQPQTTWLSSTRLAALKSLDLTFFVTTEHHCLLGRIEVKSDDIPKFRLKIRIGRKLKDTRQMRFDFVVTPDPLHGGLGDAPARWPSRAASPDARPCGGPRGLIDDLARDLRPNAAFVARARLILQRPEPASDISPPPFRDLVMVHADLLSDTPNSLDRQLYVRPLCANPCGVLWARCLSFPRCLSGVDPLENSAFHSK